MHADQPIQWLLSWMRDVCNASNIIYTAWLHATKQNTYIFLYMYSKRLNFYLDEFWIYLLIVNECALLKNTNKNRFDRFDSMRIHNAASENEARNSRKTLISFEIASQNHCIVSKRMSFFPPLFFSISAFSHSGPNCFALHSMRSWTVRDPFERERAIAQRNWNG